MKLKVETYRDFIILYWIILLIITVSAIIGLEVIN